MAQVQEKERSLVYDESETKFVAHMLTKYRSCYAQQFMIGKGLKEFKEEGQPAIESELSQMHQQICFKAVVVAELTRLEIVRSQEGVMLLMWKRS